MTITKALINATIIAPITPPTTADIFGPGSGPGSAPGSDPESGIVFAVVLISKSRKNTLCRSSNVWYKKTMSQYYIFTFH